MTPSVNHRMPVQASLPERVAKITSNQRVITSFHIGDPGRFCASGRSISDCKPGELDALSDQWQTELGAVLAKYSGRPTEAYVVFSKSAHEFVCESVVHLSTGLSCQAKAHANEIYQAFDESLEKMDKQLRRYKRRLRNHHRDRPQPVEFGAGASYILAPTEEPEEADTEALQPVVVAEMETKIPSITVGEAVMQLELGGQRMLVFRNEGHGGVNVVYRRDDGNIGWIDPRNSK
jgi:ribosomal subunit interface protein